MLSWFNFFSKRIFDFCAHLKIRHKIPADRKAFRHAEKKFALLDERQYPTYLAEYYYYCLGRKMDVRHLRRFTEKVQWLKLFDRSEQKTCLADKFLVRDWVRRVIGEEYLIPLLGHWEQFDDINFDMLPDSFVLKANHGSGMNIIVRDKNKLDRKEAKEKFDKWLAINFAFVNGFELQYKDIRPCIIAEKFLDIDENTIEYTVYCFSGEPKFVLLEVDRHSDKSERVVYDINWNKMPFCIKIQSSETNFPRPKCFDEMISLCRKMSNGFVFVRVDFYDIKGKLFFGEMTFTPGSGFNVFVPDQYDYVCGDMLKLPDGASWPKD